MEERWQSGEQRPRAASSLALLCGKGACFSRVGWTLWKINRLQLSCWALTHKAWYTARCCQWGDGKDRAEGRSSMKTYGEDKAHQVFPYVPHERSFKQEPVIQRSRDQLR